MDRLHILLLYEQILGKGKETYGVMGIEERILEPRAEEAPLRLGVAPSVGLSSVEEDCRAGVSRTNLRN